MLFNGPSATFATDQAPYIKYLSELEHEEATTLERDLRAAAALIKQQKTTGQKYCRSVIAEFLDIHTRTDGKSDSINEITTLGDGGLAVPEPKLVETFLRGLNEPNPGIHTRIISFYGDRRTPEAQAADGLLFCHILGTILDLPPGDVRVLAQLEQPMDQSHTRHRRVCLLPMKPGFISLTESTHGETRGVGAYIGKRKMGRYVPHVVVVRLPAYRYALGDLPRASVGSLFEPLVYSQWASHFVACTPHLTPGTLFNRAVKNCLRSAPPPLQDKESTGSWLSALIYMDAIVRASSIDHLAFRWPDTSNVVDPNELREISALARKTCSAIQTSVSQVVAFRRSYPSVRQSDYHDAFHYLERLLAEATNMAEEIKEILDTQHQIKNLEVSSLAVHESKSAIALTVLAFIFIPINLASSVYGMNVQEINETGHSIWGFVIAALVLLSCSGLGWVLWRAGKHGRSKAMGRALVGWIELRRHGKREPNLYEC